jgi:hypothetical protein
MSWKSVGVVIAMLAFSTSLMAQKAPKDPFLGIWELNVDKTSNYPMASQTIINTPMADGYSSMRASIQKDGKNSTEIHPVVFDGKPHQTSGGDAREISYKKIDEYTVERTHNRDGKISVDQEQVSKDGKTLTVTQQGRVRTYTKMFDVAPARH